MCILGLCFGHLSKTSPLVNIIHHGNTIATPSQHNIEVLRDLLRLQVWFDHPSSCNQHKSLVAQRHQAGNFRMEVLHALLKERNAFETEPFTAVFESNATLNASIHELQHRYSVLQIDNTRQKENIDKVRYQCRKCCFFDCALHLRFLLFCLIYTLRVA